MNNKVKLDTLSIAMDYRSIVGNCIRTFRESKGYSQDELANLMKISRTTISKIESGKFAISIDYLERLSVHLNFEIVLKPKNNKMDGQADKRAKAKKYASR